MKYDWKKQEKEWYGVKQKPRNIHIPKRRFITLKGKGNPNDEVFSLKVSALFSVAYAIKMKFKSDHKQCLDHEIHDYSVYPLEGVWGLDDTTFNKDKLEYTIMIAQPNWITQSMVDEAIKKVEKKKSNPFVSSIVFQEMEEGDCLEMLHVGSYDDEKRTFDQMDAYLKENGWKRKLDTHREIYLNNATRVSTDKLKTILRYQIEK